MYKSYVEAIINGDLNADSPNPSTSEEMRYFSVATQVINSWKKYKDNQIYQVDFEIALRDYLLTIESNINIKNYSISIYGKEQLQLSNISDEIIGVSRSFPEYIDKKFINSCYQIDAGEKASLDKKLKTNKFINDLTGFSYFKSEEQKLSVIGALKTPKGNTTLISMATGGGKSLIVHAVSYQSDGFTLVVVPTVSLMLDQVRNARLILKPKNPDEITYYNSDSDASRVAKLIEQKVIKILFISPEAIIKNNIISETIRKENEKGNLSNLVIDEAHIVVEWGNSFRIDFQCLDALRKKWITKNKKLRTFLLSATFSKRTVDFLRNSFSEENNWIEIRCDSLRVEPRYYFEKANSKEEKLSKQIELIMQLPHPMIVYVQRPQDAKEIQEQLKEYGVNNAQVFTGETSNSQREELIESWTDNEFQIMIATCAFGVGVDKKNVRTVLHLYVPDNPNKYYQEAGRGGRDGYPCLSVVLYTQFDIDSAFRFTTKTMLAKKINDRWFSMINSLNTIKYGDGKVLIDASTKPSYNESEDFLDWANERDINWNVYVIMLLKRSGLLNLLDVEYENGKYYFLVNLIERRLLKESEQIQDIIQKIRDFEWKETESEFRLIKEMLKYSSNQCVSDTFCEIYDLTDHCCSGCKNHKDPMGISPKKFPLKRQINIVDTESLNGQLHIFRKGFSIIKYNNLQTTLDIIENVIDSIVAGKYEDNKKRKFETFDFYEFIKLCELSCSFLGKIVGIILSDDENEILEIVQRTKAISMKYKINFVFLVNDDYYLSSLHKNLSTIVDAPCYQEDILEDIIKDV